ncbi:hypothetical protein V2J09_002642 [Rumex salicifolius]
MIPHSFSTDSQSKCADLASTIISATSLSQISAAVSAVDSHLHSLSPDQSRHFFSLAFPNLICKLFGFADSSSSPKASPPPPGWIDAVSASADSDLSGKLFNLLSPSGVLMSSISAVDRLGLVKYMFPAERLPDWLRFAMYGERDCQAVSDLCPMLRGRVKDDQVKGKLVFQVQLNVFEYFMFWFAYYPVCKGSSVSSKTVSAPKSRKFGLENWTSSLPVFSGGGTRRGSDQKVEPDLYTRLLYAYLRAFVPMPDANANVNAYQPFSSSLLHYSNSVDDAVVLRTEFFVSTLVNYWLVDNDFSPLPVSVRKLFGLSVPFRPMLGDVPPVAGLGKVVSLFIRYLTLCSIVASEVPEPAQYGGSPRWRKSGLTDSVKSLEATAVSTSIPSALPWNSWIQRPLYRFILRTFLFCPVGTSMNNVSGVVSVWIAYMQPWKLSKDDFLELDSMMGSSNKIPENGGQSKGHNYSSVWQDYVLLNYLYYTSLVMHFIGFAHKFLHTNPELVIQMVAKIISVLTCSKELLDLIKNVDTVFHSRQARSCKPALHNLYKIVTPIREELQDWEDGLCESGADGSFLHDNWNNDLQIFSDGEDGGQQLLQLFILRAESELQALSANPSSLQHIDLLKSQLCCLFGDRALKQSPSTPDKAPNQQSRDEIFMPRRVGNRSLNGAKYKGDWIRRPISDDEVAWLAKLLIHLSIYLNESLGLNQVGIPENPNCSYAELASDRGDDEHGPTESFKIVLSSLVSWLQMVRLVVIKMMVKYGIKINLRILASKKFIMLLLMFMVFSLLRKAFRVVHNPVVMVRE